MTTPKSKQGFWWYKLSVAQHVTDMAGMSLLEQGIYQQLMWLNHQRGPLPTDTGKLSRLVGCAPDEIETFLDPDIGGCHFTFTDDGFLVHKGIEYEREFTRQKSEKRRIAGQAGGIAKRDKVANATSEGGKCNRQGWQTNCNSPGVEGDSKPAAPKAAPSAAEAEDAETASIMAKGGDEEGWS